MSSPPPPAPPPSQGARLREVFGVFLRLGLTSFGGPAAHIALMEEELVRRRYWVSHQEFLDLLSASNLIPGPNSTELAIHLGYRRAGRWGLLLAGSAFILPAFVLVLGAAWAYVRFGQLPALAGLLYGVKPVILGIVLQAVWSLGRTALRSRFLLGLAIAVALAFGAGAHELALLGAAGLLAMLWSKSLGSTRHSAAPGGSPALAPPWWLVPAIAPAAVIPFSLSQLFLFFLKVGSVLFGSGYVLLAYLRTDLVERWGWLSETQLLDAIALGQITPGPLFTTATFIGYLLGGTPGAVVATVGIFLPAFVFVAISSPFLPRLRQSPLAAAFLDGVNAASLALMAVVSLQLARAAVIDPLTIALFVVATLLLFIRRVPSTWLVLGGAILGLVAPALRS